MPELKVDSQLLDLADLEIRVSDSGVVLHKSCYSNVSCPFCEPIGSNRIWRHKEQDQCASCNGDSSRNQVHISPWTHNTLYVAQAVVRQWSHDGDIACSRTPSTHPEGLLLLLVLASHSHCPARRYASFKEAKKETLCIQGLAFVDSGNAA